MAAKEVYRLTFTSSEILSILEAVTVPAVMATCNSDARSLINKLRKKAFEINNGLAIPSYVTNGTKGSGIQNITVDDLGGYNDSLTEGANVAASLFSSNASNNTQQSKPSADLTAEEEAFLLAEEKRMLESVANNGAGSENVIPERRKSPRTIQETYTTDDL